VAAERPQPVAVVTVDDQPFFRAAVRDVIAVTSGFDAVGEASSGREGVRMVCDLAPELVLVDVRMPDVDGLETTRRIKARRPETVVALVSIEDMGAIADAAERCGADALVPKQGFGPAVLRRLWHEHGPEGPVPGG
jgi:two-component system, NarL family, invasion response regulator UvrY